MRIWSAECRLLVVTVLLSASLAADHEIDVQVMYPPDPESEGVGLTAEIHCDNDFPRDYQFRWYYDNQEDTLDSLSQGDPLSQGASPPPSSAIEGESSANRTHDTSCSTLITHGKATDKASGVLYTPGNHTLRIEVWEHSLETLKLWGVAYHVFFLPADIADVTIQANSSYVQTHKPVALSATVLPSLSLTGPLQFTWSFTKDEAEETLSGSDSGAEASVMQDEITHVFATAGTYTAKVTVSNVVGSRSAHYSLVAQDAVEGGNLTCHEAARREAESPVCCTIADVNGSDVKFKWEFVAVIGSKDASGCHTEAIYTANNTACHTFNRTGEFEVRVRASNFVSEVTFMSRISIPGSSSTPILAKALAPLLTLLCLFSLISLFLYHKWWVKRSGRVEVADFEFARGEKTKHFAVAFKKRVNFFSSKSVHYGTVDLYEL